MIAKTPPAERPPERPRPAGASGTYGQGDFVESAQRSRLRKDQHFAAKASASEEVPDPYGEGGFAAGRDGPDGSRQSGYGADYGQLEASQRHEKPASERDYRRGRGKGNTR